MATGTIPDGVVIERNVMVPMRNGVRLATDIYRPSKPGQFPVLLQRLPYGKTSLQRVFLDPTLSAQRDYVVVVQDSRGRFDSEGEWYPFHIDLWATSNVCQAGHRMRLEVSSSNFPHFEPNPNTGHPLGQDEAVERADQAVFHDACHPSHLILPVIPRV